MSRSEEIKSLQEVIKNQDTEIKRLKADNEIIRAERDYQYNTNESRRNQTEDIRALENSNDYLRKVIAKSNKGFGLHITKQA
jgi:hypothetical protein